MLRHNECDTKRSFLVECHEVETWQVLSACTLHEEGETTELCIPYLDSRTGIADPLVHPSKPLQHVGHSLSINQKYLGHVAALHLIRFSSLVHLVYISTDSITLAKSWYAINNFCTAVNRLPSTRVSKTIIQGLEMAPWPPNMANCAN